MLIASHIIKPPGCSAPYIIDHMPGYDHDLFSVMADKGNGSVSAGSGHTQEEAVANWNALFSNAPIQYTDIKRGGNCE